MTLKQDWPILLVLTTIFVVVGLFGALFGGGPLYLDTQDPFLGFCGSVVGAALIMLSPYIIVRWGSSMGN